MAQTMKALVTKPNNRSLISQAHVWGKNQLLLSVISDLHPGHSVQAPQCIVHITMYGGWKGICRSWFSPFFHQVGTRHGMQVVRLGWLLGTWIPWVISLYPHPFILRERVLGSLG